MILEAGMTVEWWSIIPFVIMLGCIAVLPLIHATEHVWEKNSTKLAVALVLGVPVAVWFVLGGASRQVVHSLFEYFQFIALLLALFVVSGGIFLTGDIRATPKNNTIFLAIGGVIASFVGTTGAAMLLIRPLLNTNKERAYRVHTVIFTIFIVANCGGLLTPLGDPPLFLGFLRGVPFTWTFHLFPEWLFVNILLLVTYYGLDRKAYSMESDAAIWWDSTAQTRLGLKGKINLLFFAVIIFAVALLPSLDLHAIEEGNAPLLAFIPVRELVMFAAAAGSYFLGDKIARFEDNQFTWTPILEVAALFIGIFLTMMPALNYLGQVADQLPLNAVTFFVFTGGLSAVLDNAPTYATFFEMASQLPGDPRIAEGFAGGPGVPEIYLVSISLGAVFCGAITYIGNGPNFMTKAVADSAGVKMPSFGGYVKWAFLYLVPTLTAMCLIFIATGLLWNLLGIVIAALLGVRAVWLARNHVHPSEKPATAQGVTVTKA